MRTWSQEQIEEQEQERRDRVEHRDALNDIKATLSTKHGRSFVRYLLKNFEVGELPPVGMEGNLLMDRLGFLRAGQSVFDLVSEAEPEIAASILAQLIKEKNASI